jgi:HEAT repeat protein
MPSVDEYINDLKAGDFDARKIAATRLGESRDARALEPLLAALGDESWSIRASAISGLGHLYLDVAQVQAHRERIISSILPFMADDTPGLLINTMRALRWLKAEEATDAIVACLSNEDSAVRGEAIKTLGALGSKVAIPRFVEIVADKSHEKWDRVWAVAALGNLADAQAVEPLIAALADELPEIRHTAAAALAQIGDRRAVEPIRALLKDSNDDVRFQAIQATVAFNDIEALPILRVMARDDTGWGDGQPMSKRAEQAVRTLTHTQNNPLTNVGSVMKGIGRAITMPLALFRRRK